MIWSICAASSPCGHPVSRRARRTIEETAHTSARFCRNTRPMARLTSRTPTITPTRSRLAPSAPAIDAPTAAITPSVTDAATNVATTAHPATASSAPCRRYWRNAYTGAINDPAGSEFVIELAASVMAAMGPMPTSALPARSSLRCTWANARNDPASAATPSTTHPQCRPSIATVASVSSPLCPTSCSKTSAASASPMTYLATGQTRPRRARHGCGVVILRRAVPESGSARGGPARRMPRARPAGRRSR